MLSTENAIKGSWHQGSERETHALKHGSKEHPPPSPHPPHTPPHINHGIAEGNIHGLDPPPPAESRERTEPFMVTSASSAALQRTGTQRGVNDHGHDRKEGQRSIGRDALFTCRPSTVRPL
ncbi:hypothetical protein NHX12_004240 [Muraenolepis orangiensis]|uniref:Uncharacterized protein n=1 Tax=Muraenolepis orangiensis TaxID=630683 RepID=A0A9Q0DXD9_9TELE|nr:hypothetical protein NHX12_004240 [Muraenolepis orangiensis]